MLQSILIGLDGSPYSRNAIELGLRWAKRNDALLVGLGIIDEASIRQAEPVPLGGGAFKDRLDEEQMVEARRKVEQFLEQFALRCAEEQVACKVLEDVGSPDAQILLEAQRFDLILLGQQTFFHFETQESADDTVSRVLRNSARPVVTVPEKLSAGAGVLVAYDGSLQAARTLQIFQTMGLARDQEVYILSVHPDHAQAARHAGRAAEFLQLHNIKPNVHALASATAITTILLEQIDQLRVELLVMGAYGKSTFRELIFGSVTRTMLRQSSVPMFLYH